MSLHGGTRVPQATNRKQKFHSSSTMSVMTRWMMMKCEIIQADEELIADAAAADLAADGFAIDCDAGLSADL